MYMRYTQGQEEEYLLSVSMLTRYLLSKFHCNQIVQRFTHLDFSNLSYGCSNGWDRMPEIWDSQRKSGSTTSYVH